MNMNDDLLRIYLNDHLATSVALVEQVDYCLSNNPGGELEVLLPRLLGEIREEQAILKDTIDRIGGLENPVKKSAAWLAEKVHRTKPSGSLFGYTHLARMEELEEMVVAVSGKRALWQALGTVSATDDRFDGVDFDALVRRSERQIAAIEPHRIAAARRAFTDREDESQKVL